MNIKKIWIFIVFSAFVALCGRCTRAFASVDIIQEAEERVTTKANIDGIRLTEYPYTFSEYYEADAKKHVKYVTVMFSKYPLLRYDLSVHGGATELDAVVPNNIVVGTNGLHLANADDCFYYTYNASTQEVYSRTEGYGKTYMFTERENYYFNVMSETSHDIFDYDTNTLVFRGAPHRTELAKVTEQTMSQYSPTTQVISLLPLLISLVVSFLGLRKLLQLLRTVLSKA